MKKYTFEIVEKLTRVLLCTVYAETLDEAKEKAEHGDTVDEWNHRSEEVIDRVVLELQDETEIPESEGGKL